MKTPSLECANLTRTPAVPGCDGRRASVLLNSLAVDAILSLSDMAQHRRPHRYAARCSRTHTRRNGAQAVVDAARSPQAAGACWRARKPANPMPDFPTPRAPPPRPSNVIVESAFHSASVTP